MFLSLFQNFTTPQQPIDRLALWLTTGGYSSHFRMVPATVGSMVGLLLYVPMAKTSPLAQLALIVVFFVVGIWASGHTEAVMKIKDARPIMQRRVCPCFAS
jgi:hypothetical protein